MNPGDKVEVSTVWAQTPEGPVYHWFKGYEFISTDGKITRVKVTHGAFAGMIYHFDACCVRPVSSFNNPRPSNNE